MRREVNSYHPKPIKLRDFPGMDPDAISQLEQAGIQHTLQLFPKVLSPHQRRACAFEHQIGEDTILELTKLTDVARLKWVGPKFARLLVESDYDTVEKIAQSDYVELFEELMRVNDRNKIYRGALGMDDLKDWVDVYVQDVPQVIQY